jgi:hypothetical protein
MRDYKKEYREYHARPEQKKNRAARNLWNRRLKGRVPAGKEIDHRRPLAAGGGNTQNNIRFRSVSANRGDKSHMKTAQKGPAHVDESRDEQLRRNILRGLAGAGILAGGAYLLKNRAPVTKPRGAATHEVTLDVPDKIHSVVDNATSPRASVPNATSPRASVPNSNPSIGAIMQAQQRDSARVFELTEDNVLAADPYSIKKTLESNKKAYGEVVRSLHNELGQDHMRTIINSPTGNKLIMLMQLESQGKLSPGAGMAALEDARRHLSSKYGVPFGTHTKRASVVFMLT